ncbi:MAG: DUF1080 domain-containing protein [Nitrospiraceae bacterium]|nr:DUF1080 domain-containing protein [Nitrospiraceae bacterium]
MRARVAVQVVVIGLAAVLVCGVAVADEWINLFDQETLFGWTAIGDAEWSVSDGVMACKKGSGGWLATTSQFQDFELVVKMRVAKGGSASLVVRAALAGHPSENGTTIVPVSTPEGGEAAWKTINVKAVGGDVIATIDGEAVDIQAGSRGCGYIGFLYHRTGRVEVSEAKLRPLNMKPIFNGTDLSEWNIIPDHASKFNVVDGAINITDGNGQIETKGTYKNFMLQLDIISNGEHLNSGVFFRGPVGVFWKGYESQVRNQWSKKRGREYPVDFGTGGNYGNQAARKVVSTDGEWFTKTIVCDGNHAAVWIDGYLASDYIDMRPVSGNANGKEGYVPGPGTIHLQGHDPTTDLSFKNIMIQEYPAE